ncbi:hypothetical protein BC332_24506 [Capsicum chinense]|nr:hypothetical protein BC332_24506 [Capsicum chinense]
MRTIHQSMELTACDLLQFYKKHETLRAMLEKPWKATDDLEASTSLDAEITGIAYTTEDMIDSESRNILLAQRLPLKSNVMNELI